MRRRSSQTHAVEPRQHVRPEHVGTRRCRRAIDGGGTRGVSVALDDDGLQRAPQGQLRDNACEEVIERRAVVEQVPTAHAAVPAVGRARQQGTMTRAVQWGSAVARCAPTARFAADPTTADGHGGARSRVRAARVQRRNLKKSDGTHTRHCTSIYIMDPIDTGTCRPHSLFAHLPP